MLKSDLILLLINKRIRRIRGNRMTSFGEMIKISLGRKNETDTITRLGEKPSNDLKVNKDIDPPTKQELLLWKLYGLLPEELAEIEEELDISIEKDKPKKLEKVKEEDTLGLDPKVKRHLDKHYRVRLEM